MPYPSNVACNNIVNMPTCSTDRGKPFATGRLILPLFIACPKKLTFVISTEHEASRIADRASPLKEFAN